MKSQISERFLTEVSKTLSFLHEEYGFGCPRLETELPANMAEVVFLGRNLAIEFILDERERDVSCKIARVVNGKKTNAYELDKNGTVVRDSFTNLLLRRGVRPKFTNVGQLTFEEMIPVTLSDFARLLRAHGNEVLSDLPTAVI